MNLLLIWSTKKTRIYETNYNSLKKQQTNEKTKEMLSYVKIDDGNTQLRLVTKKRKKEIENNIFLLYHNTYTS